jgi:FixJ family two-component response regulator
MAPTPFIAIVDDEDPIRRALLRLLRSAGLDAQTFAAGGEFLQSLPFRVPCCVVLDLHMPGMNGFELHARLAQSWPQVQVIVITGHHSDESHAQSLENGFLAYLTKPIDDRLLLEVIDRAMPKPVMSSTPQ